MALLWEFVGLELLFYRSCSSWLPLGWQHRDARQGHTVLPETSRVPWANCGLILVLFCIFNTLLAIVLFIYFLLRKRWLVYRSNSLNVILSKLLVYKSTVAG